MVEDSVFNMKNKVDTVLNIARPNINTNKDWSFIGAVNCYTFLWPHHFYLFKSLVESTGSKSMVCDNLKQKDFDVMNTLMVSNSINKHPRYTKACYIFTKYFDDKLSAATIQDGKLIIYYSKNWSKYNITTLLMNTSYL